MTAGDYCYIKGISRDYGIGRITQLNSGYSSNDGELIDIQFKHSKCSFPKIEVISSPNIIDLIEEGDYVNGVIVSQSYIDNIKHIAPEIKENNYGIKSIVTKEQFEAMEYKIIK